ncbi:MAG: asparagine--tRNA ligase [Bacteroidota bacterium]|nr:asparagine--tRNA ligase [Bacteroidota bacterium]
MEHKDLHTASNTIAQLPQLPAETPVKLNGWLQNKRDSKGLVFINLRDGSGFVQCVVAESVIGLELFDIVKRLGLESSLTITGILQKDDRQIGGQEIQATEVTIHQSAENYPITPKDHGVDFLLDRRHLWLRSKKQWAIMRIRNKVIFSIHNFFQDRGFVQMDAPIFTGNAVEGTSTLFETDFFEEPAYLSQSGQLYGEAMAMAMGKIYTFGPTFRAEKSKTRRHLSEFWMIEPEMAYYNLDMTMDVIEEFLRYVVQAVLDTCQPELEILERDVAKLQTVTRPFTRIPYSQAVRQIKGLEDVNGQNSIKTLEADLEKVQSDIISLQADITAREEKLNAGGMKKGEINFNEEKIRQIKLQIKELEEQARNIPTWLQSAKDFVDGNDFGGSDETVLTRLYDTPIMVYNWPKPIKAFYMKEAENAPGFVRGVDVLAPEGYGEIVGGGERETNIDNLINAINHHELPMEAFEWYLDLRRYGSVPHSGFGLGLERIICWICKLPHVRESIPFPRFMGNLLP